MRGDQLLVARGLAPSRTAAQRLIEAGRVSWNSPQGTQPVAKASQALPDSAELCVAPDPADRYVSRGGLKLAGALIHCNLDVSGYFCLDVGQSTGGFTDCLLQAGAARVVGVEVGHGQLHPKLLNDPRVLCVEGVNARQLTLCDLKLPSPPEGEGEGENPRFDLIVTDASFISLTLLLPNFPALLKPGGRVLALVKPQFEVGPRNLGKGGIVRDTALYAGVEEKIRAACKECKLEVLDWFDSPITGTDGNREFFILALTP